MSQLLDCDDQLTQFLAEHPDQQQVLQLQDMVEFEQPHGLQLVDTVAQDHAITDAQCELDVALRDKVVSLEDYLFHTRKLALDQFFARALVNKIANKQAKMPAR